MSADGLKFFAHELGHYYFFGRHEPGVTDIWGSYRENPVDLGMLGSASCVGTPSELRERLRAYEEAEVDQVFFVSQAGSNRHEDICASMELFSAAISHRANLLHVRRAPSDFREGD